MKAVKHLHVVCTVLLIYSFKSKSCVNSWRNNWRKSYSPTPDMSTSVKAIDKEAVLCSERIMVKTFCCLCVTGFRGGDCVHVVLW